MNSNYPQFIPMIPDIKADPKNEAEMTVYVDSSPYPEVTGSPDPVTVEMLKNDYAGAKGELTAITLYIFQNQRSTDNDTYANSVLQLAIVEMIHLDLLGDAIVALGGNPSFDNGQYYWSAKNVNYATEYREMLKVSLEAEQTAIANYEKHIARTNNESVKALLRRIVKDEELHVRFFSELLSR